jgi:hypothetical protein
VLIRNIQWRSYLIFMAIAVCCPPKFLRYHEPVMLTRLVCFCPCRLLFFPGNKWPVSRGN